MKSKKVDLKSLSDTMQGYLLGVLRDVEKEDTFVRYQQIKAWKRSEQFWHGVQYIYWNELAQDWRVPTQQELKSEETRDATGPFYDYVINIYKAHGESIIAALSLKPPTVEYFPDDADKQKDILAARSKSKIAILLQKHNRVKLLLLDAMHKLFNQGLICAYTCNKSDKAYGTKKIPVYKDEEVPITKNFCPTCLQDLGTSEGTVQTPNSLECPECGPVTPFQEQGVETRPVLKEEKELPKSRQLLEIWGPLNVKVPYYVKELKQAGYLLHFIEQHVNYLKDLYPDRRDEIPESAGSSSLDASERYARVPSNFASPDVSNEGFSKLLTVRKLWLRPWMFEHLKEEYDITFLKEMFPDGAFLTFIGEKLFDAYAESMDDHWSLCKAGPSSYIHSDALGNPLMPIQELKNNLTNLTAQTIEYGIPADFAESDVLDFDEYGQQEASPGTITPVKAKPGKSLGESFYQMKTSTLSREVDNFANRLDEDAQFTTGSQAPIYGGPSEGKTRTLGEYQQSRTSALQRLGIVWTYVQEWWATLIGQAVDGFIENMDEEEKYVQKEGESFTNILVRKADLLGKTAALEPEVDEDFPITAGQKRAMLMEFIQLNNDMINAVIQHPENVKEIAQALGFPQLHIPGEDQRIKQLIEIKILLSQPEPFPLEPEEIDDNEIHAEVLRSFLSNIKGQEQRILNPIGYQNCIIHYQMHQQKVQLETMTLGPGAEGVGEAPDSASVGAT